jgi:hypothetical protein
MDLYYEQTGRHGQQQQQQQQRHQPVPIGGDILSHLPREQLQRMKPSEMAELLMQVYEPSSTYYIAIAVSTTSSNTPTYCLHHQLGRDSALQFCRVLQAQYVEHVHNSCIY